MRTYTLTVTEAQARLLSEAAELLGRLHMGQFDSLDYLFAGDIPRGLFDALKVAMFPELPGGQFYSISNAKLPDKTRVAWDMHAVIRHRLAWDNHPEGGPTNQFYEPRHLGAEPLAEIREVEA
jgi:hypothetical protein